MSAPETSKRSRNKRPDAQIYVPRSRRLQQSVEQSPGAAPASTCDGVEKTKSIDTNQSVEVDGALSLRTEFGNDGVKQVDKLPEDALPSVSNQKNSTSKVKARDKKCTKVTKPHGRLSASAKSASQPVTDGKNDLPVIGNSETKSYCSSADVQIVLTEIAPREQCTTETPELHQVIEAAADMLSMTAVSPITDTAVANASYICVQNSVENGSEGLEVCIKSIQPDLGSSSAEASSTLDSPGICCNECVTGQCSIEQEADLGNNSSSGGQVPVLTAAFNIQTFHQTSSTSDFCDEVEQLDHNISSLLSLSHHDAPVSSSDCIMNSCETAMTATSAVLAGCDYACDNVSSATYILPNDHEMHSKQDAESVSTIRMKNVAESDGDSNESDWESLFDESGEAVKCKPACSVTAKVQKSTEKVDNRSRPVIDYNDYQLREPDLSTTECGHLIEIYDFPVEFQTRDLLCAFVDYKDKGFDIKWVDDTHAVGVFSSPIAANSVLAHFSSPLMKVRSIETASRQTKLKAKRTAEFLQPYKARPETTASVARNMVAGALGIKNRLSKEQREEERRKLKEAKERKREADKMKHDAWDGNFNS